MLRRAEKYNIALFTCVYGHYETSLYQHEIARETNEYTIDLFCFTDDSNALQVDDRWEVIEFEPYAHWLTRTDQACCTALRQMYNVVLLRANPHKLRELVNYDACIYVDANVCIKDATLLLNTLSRVGFAAPHLILSKHPDRTCAYDEAKYCFTLKKYQNTDLQLQINSYLADGMPPHAGLFWNGLLIYIQPRSTALTPFYDAWSREMTSYVRDNAAPYHSQGQVSLPYILWKMGWLPTPLNQSSTAAAADEDVLVVLPNVLDRKSGIHRRRHGQ